MIFFFFTKQNLHARCRSGRNLSRPVYVLGKRVNIYYVTSLRQFKSWKHFPSLNEGKNCNFFPGLHCYYHPRHPSCSNEPHLFANVSLCSDSSQYAILFSRSLIRFFSTSGIGPNCILSYSLYFFKFSTSSQNVQFHIHRSHMEIGLSEVTKFFARKMIKKTHFMSPCKMINLFQDVVTNFSA